MSSPLPPDPYSVLGVSSTADLATIRSAHRKLVLKFHPDRIRDEAEREKGKLEFQKVQQAYEILADEGSRDRYDNKVKLAELQRERFAKETSRPPPATYSSRPSPPLATVRRETRTDGRNYEERAPPADYFDSRDHYDDPLPRSSTAKKYDSYDKKSSPAPKSAEKKEKSGWARYMAPEGVPIRVAMNLKARASEARERTKDHAQTRETKDRERRKERSEKTYVRRAVVVDEESSSSESDTVVPPYRPTKSSKPPPSRTHAATESDSRARASPPRRRYEDDFDSREEQEKWERHHQMSRDYIAQSQKRPPLARKGSDVDHYWGGDSKGGRRSGDDSDRKPSSSRRAAADDRRAYPSIPVQTSAPNNLRSHIIEREPVKEPQRSKAAAYPTERDHRREVHVPGLSRSQTMPVPRGVHRDGNAPSKGSNLKHAETQQDSGYSSNSTPHTPEMRGDSPIRDSPRQPTRRQTSTKYAIVEPESEEDTNRRPRLSKMVDSDDDRPRRYRSPDPAERRAVRRTADHPERPRLPKLDTDTRARPGRVQEVRSSMPRGEFAPYESASPRQSPTVDHRKGLFGEIPREDREPSYSYRPDPASVRTSSHRSPNYASYREPRDVDHDHAPSAYRPSMHSSGRRSSATAY